MHDAKLYHNSNSLQKRGTEQCLEEYATKIKWKNFDRVIDIGCGDGDVTMSVLKKFIPKTCKQLVGCDISKKMVEFANSEYNEENTSFSVLDIVGELPEDFKKNFDHAFSFYTLHWIKDQEGAFTNIYNLLNDGGDCLLIFLGHMPIFDVFRVLSKQPKWRTWLKDVERFVSPYHDSQEPEKDVKRLMTKIGFKNIAVECKAMSFVFNKLEVCKKAVAAVNPFKIPPELQNEFLEDYVQIVKDMNMIDYVNNNVDDYIKIKSDYNLIVAYGTRDNEPDEQ